MLIKFCMLHNLVYVDDITNIDITSNDSNAIIHDDDKSCDKDDVNTNMMKQMKITMGIMPVTQAALLRVTVILMTIKLMMLMVIIIMILKAMMMMIVLVMLV